MARPATLRSNRGTLSPARHRRSNGIRGIEGYGASTVIRKTHMLRFSPDAPILVQIVDTAENIQKLIPVLDEMVLEGLIAMSDVEVIKYVHQQGSFQS